MDEKDLSENVSIESVPAVTPANDVTPPKPKSRRGFAAMDPARQRAIASLGGRAAHDKGTAHEWSSDEARNAGSRGGKVAHSKGTAHEWSSDEARVAGRKGGEAAHRERAARTNTAA